MSKTVQLLGAVAVLVNVVRGQDLVCGGSCVGTWKKCAGEGIPSGTIRPCCNSDDQCVKKTARFSQCRPMSRDTPSSWDGAILTCEDPPDCDPTAITARLSGLSAFRFADNDDIKLDFLDPGDLQMDYMDITCLEACQENPDCFAFDETADGECILYGKNLFTLEGTLQPFFDAEVFLTKCFLPEPLCDPATREVRQINAQIAPDGLFHQMEAESDLRNFFVTPREYALTAAINACRLQQSRLGGCIGFAIDGADLEGRFVTLLYNRGRLTTDYRGDLAADPEVYSIAECL